MKKFFSLLLSAVVIINTFAIFGFSTTAYAATYAQTLKNKGFPDSYIPYLETLHKTYPNWVFEPVNTGLDWQTAVNGERSSHGNQLIEKCSAYPTSYYCSCSSCYKNGSYVIREGSNWVAASEIAVKYYMDPRNFLTDQYIFQFESTAYDGTQSKKGVEAILDGTWMHNSLISYNSTQGKSVYYDTTTKYSDAIMDAANASGMSAYYLASKIRQENGGATASATAVKGTASPFIGIYNYYNISANTGAYQGLAFAAGYLKLKNNSTMYSTYSNGVASGTKTSLKSGQYMTWISTHGDYFYVRLYTENSSNSYTAGKTGYVLRSDIRTDYVGSGSSGWGRPWSNPYKSIYWGAKYIAKNFSSQNTGYLQKFNVSPKSSYKYSNEYMANVAAAAAESKTTYNAYKSAGILSLTKKFEIPVFNNMPASTTAKTGWNKIDNKWYYYDASGSMAVGWKKIDNVYYYFNNSGVMQTGWVKVNNKWYYLNDKGAMQRGWIKLNEKWYYLNTDGSMQVGWLKYNEKWYYFNDDGSMKTGWLTYKNKRYFLADSGIMKTGWFKYNNKYWFFLTDSGAARTGWYKENEKWYYFDPSSCIMIAGKWREIKNEWYYFDADGVMITGWFTFKEKKYYFKESGAMATRVLDIDGTSYIFDANGALQTSYVTGNEKMAIKTIESTAAKTIYLTWDKPDIPNSGYQIMWSTTKDFSSNWLMKTSGSKTKLDYTLTTAQSNKYYYVKVRAYRVAYDKDGNRSDIYFPWSATKAIKVK